MAIDWARLSVVLGNHSHAVPAWARALCEIGERMAQPEEDAKIRITVLSLPDLRYAASLVATGVAIAKFKSRRVVSSEAKKSAHKERIKGLEKGSLVEIRETHKSKYRGVFLGKHPEFPHLFQVKIEEEGDHIRASAAEKITIIDQGEVVSLDNIRRIPIPAPKGGRFLAEYLGSGEDAEAFVTQKEMQTAIVGSKASIEETIKELRLCCEQEKGCLADIVRPKEYVAQGKAYTARILSSQKKNEVELPKEAVVIYSGSLHFIKARPKKIERQTVVLLNRKDAQFESALDILRKEANFSDYDELPELDRLQATEGFSYTREIR